MGSLPWSGAGPDVVLWTRAGGAGHSPGVDGLPAPGPLFSFSLIRGMRPAGNSGGRRFVPRGREVHAWSWVGYHWTEVLTGCSGGSLGLSASTTPGSGARCMDRFGWFAACPLPGAWWEKRPRTCYPRMDQRHAARPT